MLFSPRLGWVLGVKVFGRGVMAYTNRPGFRGDLLSCDSRPVPSPEGARTAYETGIEPASRCAESCAVCSVACLAWVSWDRGAKRFRPWPRPRAILPREILPAKEDRAVARCCGKHLGCLSPRGRWRIAVRTKWQSGLTAGNTVMQHRRGNRLYRRREVCCGEIQPVPKP